MRKLPPFLLLLALPLQAQRWSGSNTWGAGNTWGSSPSFAAQSSQTWQTSWMTLSANGKYIVNSFTDKPVFLTGDAPQLIFVQISNADVETYLQDRVARGFNALWCYPIDGGPSGDQTNTPKDFYGDSPFDAADF